MRGSPNMYYRKRYLKYYGSRVIGNLQLQMGFHFRHHCCRYRFFAIVVVVVVVVVVVGTFVDVLVFVATVTLVSSLIAFGRTSGLLDVSAFRRLGVGAFGRLGAWTFGRLGGCTFGRLGVWAFGRLGVWGGRGVGRLD